jgi:hypothetical protein
MSAHAEHRMHENSVAAFREEEPKLSARAAAILEWVRTHGPHTDREIAYGMGFGENLNAVRPRITELMESPHARLMEVCSRRCPKTGKTVRVVDVRRARWKQPELLS